MSFFKDRQRLYITFNGISDMAGPSEKLRKAFRALIETIRSTEVTISIMEARHLNDQKLEILTDFIDALRSTGKAVRIEADGRVDLRPAA